MNIRPSLRKEDRCVRLRDGGAKGGEGAQESPTGQLPEDCIRTNYRRETEAGMQAGARRGRGRSGKMTKSNLYALASKLL